MSLNTTQQDELENIKTKTRQDLNEVEKELAEVISLIQVVNSNVDNPEKVSHELQKATEKLRGLDEELEDVGHDRFLQIERLQDSINRAEMTEEQEKTYQHYLETGWSMENAKAKALRGNPQSNRMY